MKMQISNDHEDLIKSVTHKILPFANSGKPKKSLIFPNSLLPSILDE